MKTKLVPLILAGCLGATWMAGSASLLAAEAKADGMARKPYLQLATHNSVHVVWRTRGAIDPEVRYGTAPNRLNQKVRASEMVTRVSLGKEPSELAEEFKELLHPRFARLPKLHSAPGGLVQYEAKIKGLKPDTRYYYAVYDGDLKLAGGDSSHTFVTHPKIGQKRSTRFWVVGDSGVGKEPQTSVHRSMTDLVRKEGRLLDFYIHVGDMAYTEGRDVEFQTRFFDMYEPTLRSTVCWPSMGNHEGATSKGTNGVGPYYDAYVVPTRGEAGGLPSGTEAFYSFDYGAIHFICLDSHDLDRKPSGAMAQWLKADLERTKADWLVAFWHHPPYTMGSHNSDKEKQLIEMRQHIMPILESGGVDLVLTGHSHIYERSMLMDGAYATPTVAEHVIFDDGDGDPSGDGPYRKSSGLHPNEGTIQVVAGHGGAKISRKGTMPVMKRVIMENGSVIVDIDGDALVGKMLNKDGQIVDTFGLVKRGRVSPVRIASPKQLPSYTPPRSNSDDSGDAPPDDFIVLIDKNAVWSYMAGSHPSTTNWTTLTYNALDWKTAPADFGYSRDRAHTTELNDMKDRYTTVYIRRDFQVENADYVSELGLMIDYDDGFIAYLNGMEVLRKSVGKGRGDTAESVRSHSAGGYRYYPLKDVEKAVRTGRNVLAIEGHNRDKGSSDFTLDPYLIMED